MRGVHLFTAQQQESTIIESWSGEDRTDDYLRYNTEAVQEQHKCDHMMIRQDMVLTLQEQTDFDAILRCTRCHAEFDNTDHKNARNHCGITVTALSVTNTTANFISYSTLSVIFHNFKCYDIHLKNDLTMI